MIKNSNGYVILLFLFAGKLALVSSYYMKCGEDVDLCGVLTLESGYGPKVYASDTPAVHGLWPEVEPYGNSDCLKPLDSKKDPTIVAGCYQNGTEDPSSQLHFEIHEWEKHGWCSGVRDADDYFTQVCTLAAPLLEIMAEVKSEDGTLEDMNDAVEKNGYEVFFLDEHYKQLYFSACATPEGVWKLARMEDFPVVCGGWGKIKTKRK